MSLRDLCAGEDTMTTTRYGLHPLKGWGPPTRGKYACMSKLRLHCATAAQVVATDVNQDNLASLINEAPDIRAEVMDVKKYEDVEIVIPGVRRARGIVPTCHLSSLHCGAAG